MVHIKFDPNSISLSEFEVQIGQGEYNYFRGSSPYQRGYGYRQTGAGVGDFLRTLWRAVLPSLKSAGKVLGQEALSTGSRVLDKVAQGENLKETLREETIKGVDNLVQRGKKQLGGGTIKALKTDQYRIIPSKRLHFKKQFKHPSSAGPRRRKRNRSDAFGLY